MSNEFKSFRKYEWTWIEIGNQKEKWINTERQSWTNEVLPLRIMSTKLKEWLRRFLKLEVFRFWKGGHSPAYSLKGRILLGMACRRFSSSLLCLRIPQPIFCTPVHVFVVDLSSDSYSRSKILECSAYLLNSWGLGTGCCLLEDSCFWSVSID